MKFEINKESCDFISETSEDADLLSKIHESLEDNASISLSYYDDDSDDLMLTIYIK